MADTASGSQFSTRIDPPRAPSYQTLTGIAVGVVIVGALYFGKEVLLPITVAVLLSFVLSPIVELLRRFRIPRVVAAVFSAALALTVIGGVGALVGAQLVQTASDLPQYQSTIEKKLSAIQNVTLRRATELARQLPGWLHQTGQKAATNGELVSPAGGPAPAQEKKRVLVEVRQPPIDPLTLAERLLTPVLHPLATAVIVFVVAVFILIQQDDLRDRIIRLCGSRDLPRTTLAMQDAAHRLSRFFLVQLGINTAFGVIVGFGLYFIGLPSPLLWGTIAALMRFLPYLGSYVAAGVPILLAAAIDPGWSAALCVAALFIVTEPILGQVVEPMLYGRSTGLSPIAVVIAAIFWAWLWGPVGLILSTPITLCLVVLGQHVEQLQFLKVLLGDRPALSRVENFYERVLAGDTDELQEHAEHLLKEVSISWYYDDIAMNGLGLAANDVSRGVLTPSRVERIRDTVATLVAELETFSDMDPPPNDPAEASEKIATKHLPKTHVSVRPNPFEMAPAWRAGEPIRCVAGHGQLDEAAATMLAQLLNKQGLGATVIPHGAVSRAAIREVGSEGVTMVCVCYLDIFGSTSSLRFLLRRLRQRMPGARQLVALWPSDHPVIRDDSLKATLGADVYVTSLQEAVNACLKAAREAAVTDQHANVIRIGSTSNPQQTSTP